jgi:hypothetical protein
MWFRLWWGRNRGIWFAEAWWVATWFSYIASSISCLLPVLLNLTPSFIAALSH